MNGGEGWGEVALIIFSSKTRPRTPILFKSGFSKVTYNYFNYFGPWTADVHGPLLNLCVMNVITTALNDRPVKNPGPVRRDPMAAAPARPPGQTSSFQNFFGLQPKNP
jgi:hypothetical protein